MTSIGGSSDLPEWGGGCKRDVIFKYPFSRVFLLLCTDTHFNFFFLNYSKPSEICRGSIFNKHYIMNI